MASEQTPYKLTAKEILKKEFKTGIRGYSPEDVDKFLDDIIADYGTFTKEIEALKAENARLTQELSKSVERRSQESTSTFTPPIQPAGTTNFDILKRLSNLEKHVFGSKLGNHE